ncbi:MAG: glycosyltransferase [Gemmatimonadota bacterium]|nr:glycosyltransferase [Gemmatimonadota bacterium]
MPIRVLHVESGHEWRATRDQVRLLVDGLRGEPHIHQAVATLEGSRLARETEEMGVPVVPLPWATGTDPRALRMLAKVAATDWDVLHAHDTQALRLLVYVQALEGSRTALVASRRVVGLPASGWKWRRARVVLAVSNGARRDLLAAGVEPCRVIVVRSGIDVGELHPQLVGRLRDRVGARDEHLLVGSDAALEANRDHETLVRAAVGVSERQDRARFALLGDGPARRRLEALIDRYGLAGRVCLPGFVPDARRSLADCDVFVLPARGEELATSALDALGAGVPVVLPTGDGPERFVGSGIVPVPRGDPVAMAEAIGGLLDDPERRRRLGEQGRRFAEAHGRDRMVRGTLRAYRTVMH